MSDFSQLLNGTSGLIDESRMAELLGDAWKYSERQDLHGRAVNRALNQLHPLPASLKGLDEEALLLAVSDDQSVRRCAVALSCLPRAGKVAVTIDGRFTRAIRNVLDPTDRSQVDSFVNDPNLPESRLKPAQWHNEEALFFGGLQGLLMGLEFGDAIAARFCLRFPARVFDAEPSVTLKAAPIVRQLCRKILQLDPLS